MEVLKRVLAVVGETVRKFGVLILILLNVAVAIVVGMMYNRLQHHSTPISVANTASPSPSPSSSPPGPTPTEEAFESIYNIRPSLSTSHWVSWALLDTKTGFLVGSENLTQPSYVMSMIKPWIVADYLNQHPSPNATVLDQLASMILDSNDQMAYTYFAGQPSIDRLISACGLTDVVGRGWSWSLTQMSARDSVRYGQCIYTGHATTPQWTAWIVDKMRHVRGDGDFGPRELFPDRTIIATKNGWFDWEGKWYINCLAVTDKWTIAIMQQWPYAGGDLLYGISLANPVCKLVANQVLRLNAL